MRLGIHHVGLAVRSVEEATTFFEGVFDAQRTDYSMETGEFLSRMITVGTGLLELLEPRGKGGLVERFLDTNGEGIHHVSIVVDSLDEVLTSCKEKGLRVVGNQFIHPKSAHGVLIELLDGRELR
ncbi:MAG: VOC family protein [Anaerolineae bacterium]